MGLKRENFRVIKNNKLIFYKSKKENVIIVQVHVLIFNGMILLDELSKNLRSYKVYYFKK